MGYMSERIIRKMEIKEANLSEGIRDLVPGRKKRGAKYIFQRLMAVRCRNRFQGPENKEKLDACLTKAKDDYERSLKGKTTYISDR